MNCLTLSLRLCQRQILVPRITPPSTPLRFNLRIYSPAIRKMSTEPAALHSLTTSPPTGGPPALPHPAAIESGTLILASKRGAAFRAVDENYPEQPPAYVGIGS